MPNSREDLKQYALNRLGQPVIKINVEDNQLEQRLDDALQMFAEYHFDAVEEMWQAHALSQDEIDNEYITLSDDILVVERLLNLDQVMNSNDMFSFNYQVALANLSPHQTMDMINYHITMMNINQVMDMVNPEPYFIQTRYMNKLKIHRDWNDFSEGAKIAMKVLRVIDPEQNTKVYNDIWLKRYVTALFKEQWGNNMKKHGNVEMLGGVTVNGQQIYDEAREEIENLEKELEQKYADPVPFIVG